MIVHAPVPIRVLLVEDSPVARELLLFILERDSRLHVVGTAADGLRAVEQAKRLRPDVILMDIHLPGINGYEATRQIMEEAPTRIVMITAHSDAKEVAASFQALDAGALVVLPKPDGPAHPDFEAMADEIVKTVRLMSEVRVVRRSARGGREKTAAGPAHRVIAIGASTGGPPALQALLGELGGALRVPILIVQHIAEGFDQGLVEWLARSTGYAVSIAEDGALPQAGVAYVAPSGHHMQLAASGRISLTGAPPENGVRPAVSVLFRSVAASCGEAAVGILLTGMGKDGASELKALRSAGALTFAQDEDSSVVYGMPAAAIALDGASYVLSPDKIAVVLREMFGTPRRPSEARPERTETQATCYRKYL